MIIGINAGHTLSGQGSGAVGYVNESTETRHIVSEVTKYLQNQGHTVINCTVDSANTNKEYLQKVVNIANGKNLDLFVSIHLNAFDKVAQGVEVYTYNGAEHKEAVDMVNKISALGFVKRADGKNGTCKDGSHLYVVKHTKAKAILLETFFCDSLHDVQLYKVRFDDICRAIAESISGQKIEVVNVNKCSNEHFEEAKKKMMSIGVTDGTRPKDTATREEVWSMLTRLLNHIK